MPGPSSHPVASSSRNRSRLPVDGLCPACDLDTPAASALVTYLHVHGSITDETAEQFVDLVHAWIADRYARHASGEAFEADIAERDGEFD